jgi:hypothetical protein
MCAICEPGYFISLNYTCVTCPIGCSQCISNSACDTCSGGYYLNQSSCLACQFSCFNCVNSTTCNVC